MEKLEVMRLFLMVVGEAYVTAFIENASLSIPRLVFSQYLFFYVSAGYERGKYKFN